MFRYLLTVSLMLTAGFLAGQGWERVYDGGGGGQLNDIVKSPDGGFVMVGYYNNLNRARLLKTDADGMPQATKDFFVGTLTSAEAVVATQDNGYVIAGSYRTGSNPSQVYLLKTDMSGNLLWTKTFASTYNAEGLDVTELPDGSLALCGHQKNVLDKEDIWVIKTSSNGTQQWSNVFGEADKSEKGYGLSLAADGNLIIAGEKQSNGPRDIYVLKINTVTGALIWENTFGFFDISTGNPADDVARDILVANDGHIVLAGRSNIDQGSVGLLVKIDASGSNTILWQQIILKADFYGLTKTADGGFFVTGHRASTAAQEEVYVARTNAEGDVLCDISTGRPGVDQGRAVVATPDGGAVVAGFGEFFFPTPIPTENPYAVKMDKNCHVFTSYITGNVFHDFINNCQLDPNEPGLEDWIVKVESPNFTRFAAADANGNFLLLVDTGTYNIQLYPPNDYWKSCVQDITVAVSGFTDTFSVEIPVQSEFDCPRNEIDIATPVLRQCRDNTYTVRYCNSGTVPSLDTEIKILIDPALSVSGSSIPFTQTGDTLIFDIGLLTNGECGSFTFDAFLDCNTLVGQAHCVSGRIYPDTFCNITGWDRSIVTAYASCINDTVRLSLKNIGTGDMQEKVGFVITEDVVMLTAPDDPAYEFQLNVGEELIAWKQAATGSTYRIIAEQTSGYPGLSYPTAAIEGCRAPDSSFTIGYYTMFPDDDAEPFKAVECQESYTTDFNPSSLKRGHPKGYDVEHYVEPETDLEFLIQFQNSGTDTVQQVIIRDTLSAFLDPATVHPGAASHPYDFELYGNGIVQFTLPNLNLVPGSSASEGYVKFRVSQKSDVPCDTKIFNSAAIYLDFNAPVLTNQTFHTVCADSIFVTTDDVHLIGADVKVYPNPFVESTVFEITGVKSNSGFILELYDLLGKRIFNQSYPNSTFRLYRHHLPAGFLFYRLTTDSGKPVASGKLLVR